MKLLIYIYFTMPHSNCVVKSDRVELISTSSWWPFEVT